MSTSNLYHRRPPNMRGSVLHPLNVLRQVMPDLYEHQRKKYTGREELLQQRVIPLNCLWNDVLHLSPVHPRKVAELASSEAVFWSEADWFEIDATNFTADNTAIFRYTDISISTTIAADEFEVFDRSKLPSLGEVPPLTKEYYRTADKGGKYFIFCGVPHILHRGSIDVEQAKIIRA
jgi:hypothetical protein